MSEGERITPAPERPGRRTRLRILLLVCACLIVLPLAGVALISYRNTIRPAGIVVHHSTLPATVTSDVTLDARWINEAHKQRGLGIFYWGRTYHIGYHYVILPDGTVQPGRPERCQGAHAQGHNSYLGICLIGDFSSKENPDGALGLNRPTQAQMRSLVALIGQLRERYQLPLDHVVQHKELNPNTECPGDLFPVDELRTSLNTGRSASVEPWRSSSLFGVLLHLLLTSEAATH